MLVRPSPAAKRDKQRRGETNGMRRLDGLSMLPQPGIDFRLLEPDVGIGGGKRNLRRARQEQQRSDYAEGLP